MEKIAIIFVIVMQAIDGISTTLILRRGGVERNRWLAWAMARVGVVPTLVIAKGAVVAAMVGLWAFGSGYCGPGVHVALLLIIANYGYVCTGNLLVLFRARR